MPQVQGPNMIKSHRQSSTNASSAGPEHDTVRIAEDFPERVRQQRSVLYPFLKETYNGGKGFIFDDNKQQEAKEVQCPKTKIKSSNIPAPWRPYLFTNHHGLKESGRRLRGCFL